MSSQSFAGASPKLETAGPKGTEGDSRFGKRKKWEIDTQKNIAQKHHKGWNFTLFRKRAREVAQRTPEIWEEKKKRMGGEKKKFGRVWVLNVDEGEEDDVFEMRGQLRFEEQEKGKMSL